MDDLKPMWSYDQGGFIGKGYFQFKNTEVLVGLEFSAFSQP